MRLQAVEFDIYQTLKTMFQSEVRRGRADLGFESTQLRFTENAKHSPPENRVAGLIDGIAFMPALDSFWALAARRTADGTDIQISISNARLQKTKTRNQRRLRVLNLELDLDLVPRLRRSEPTRKTVDERCPAS